MPNQNWSPKATAIATQSSRRIALKQMAALLGLSLSTESIVALAESSKSSSPKLFSASELALIGTLAELIIPTTDTPGALTANVHYFIDQFLLECRSQKSQQTFRQGLARINQIGRDNFHQDFVTLKSVQQTKLLFAIEQRKLGFSDADNFFFKDFKSLVLLGYYTSEIGATQELAYLAVPGGYQGQFPFSKIGKAWALN